MIKKVVPPLGDEGLVKVVQPLLTEYLEHGDSEEVIVSQL